MPLWDKRLSGEMSKTMKRVNSSLPIDIVLLPHDIKINEAWAEELRNAKIIDDAELKSTREALSKIADEFKDGASENLPDDEDVHSLVERRLTELAGDVGKKIHAGKSRNDQVVTGLMLYLKERVRDIESAVTELISALIRRAEEEIETVMPGYTHLQRAQPVLLSHYLMSLACSLHDDIVRIKTYSRNDLSRCPMGSGAIAGTTLKIDRKRLAKRLGFASPTPNSMQSVSDRAFVIELASHLSIVSMHLGRYAEDLIIWNTKEFGFIELPDTVATGSSMMPQKKNPDSLELIRGAAGTVFGNLMGLLTITKGLPLTYAKDLQDDKKFIFSSIETVLDSIRLFSDIIGSIEFSREKMKAAISDEMFATDIADELVKKGAPFREAYQMVAEKIKNNALGDIGGVIDAAASISKRAAPGGTSRKSVLEEIRRLKKEI